MPSHTSTRGFLGYFDGYHISTRRVCLFGVCTALCEEFGVRLHPSVHVLTVASTMKEDAARALVWRARRKVRVLIIHKPRNGVIALFSTLAAYMRRLEYVVVVATEEEVEHARSSGAEERLQREFGRRGVRVFLVGLDVCGCVASTLEIPPAPDRGDATAIVRDAQHGASQRALAPPPPPR